MAKVGLIGFGQIGIETAKILVQDPIMSYDIVAYDLKEVIEKIPGPAKGNYEDIIDGIGILGYAHTIKLTDNLENFSGADVIIFSAGLPRRADQTRADLIGANIPVVGGICEKLKNICPNAFVIMVTNPLDSMVELAYRKLGFAPERIVGQAGVLDTGRFRIQVSMVTGEPCTKISALVLGGHADTMVPVYSHTWVGYKSLKERVSAEQIEKITANVKDRGRFIITQKGHSSTFSTAVACVKMLRAYLCDTKEIMACCTRLRGEYGAKDIFVGVPTEISNKGAKAVEIFLAPEEKAALERSIAKVREEIAELDKLTK